MTRKVVQIGVVEDARRVVFEALEGLPDRQRSRLANVVTARLRDEGMLGSAVEHCYSAAALARMWCRGYEWVVNTFAPKLEAGAAEYVGPFGPIYRDDGGYLIPASTANAYLAARVFSGQRGSRTSAQPTEVAA